MIVSIKFVFKLMPSIYQQYLNIQAIPPTLLVENEPDLGHIHDYMHAD